MEKISGILPSTARVTTVDLKGSGTARSGMPNFGRETASTSFDRRAQEMNTSQRTMERQSDPKSEIVKQMADSFFMNKQKSYDAESELASKESAGEIGDSLRKSIESQVAPKNLKVIAVSDSGEEVIDESDAPSVGRHIDIQA